MRRLLVLWLVLVPSLGFGLDLDGEGLYVEGVIEQVDLPRSLIYVQGSRFWMPQTVKVEIGGSYGAFTMLEQGMRVAFTYRNNDNGRREVLELEEILSDRELLIP